MTIREVARIQLRKNARNPVAKAMREAGATNLTIVVMNKNFKKGTAK